MSLSCFIFEAYVSLMLQKKIMLTICLCYCKKNPSVCTPAQATGTVSESLSSCDEGVGWNQSTTAALSFCRSLLVLPSPQHWPAGHCTTQHTCGAGSSEPGSLREHSLNLEGQFPSAITKAATQNFWDRISWQFGILTNARKREESRRVLCYLPMLQTNLQQGAAFSQDNIDLQGEW